MKKTPSGHYMYTIEELEKFNFTPLEQKMLFGNTIKEMKKLRRQRDN